MLNHTTFHTVSTHVTPICQKRGDAEKLSNFVSYITNIKQGTDSKQNPEKFTTSFCIYTVNPLLKWLAFTLLLFSPN